MSLYAIGDLHLSFSDPSKTMSVFAGWDNYQEKIEKNWRDIVKPEDTVVLAGASTNENFLKTAFSLKLNEISAPVLLKNNVLVLKLVGESSIEDELLTSMAFFYPINAQRFDTISITNFFTGADYVKNDVVSAYLSSLE